ncbi:MAG: metallophosphoesterase [Armatimonadota bacterium]
MKPREYSKVKQFAVQSLTVIILGLLGYIGYLLYKYNIFYLYVYLAVVLGFFTYIIFIEPGNITFPERNLVIDNMPHHFKGKKIIHISDIHFGPLFGRKAVKKLVNSINNLSPDFVFITGDFLSVDTDAEIKDLIEEIKLLKAKNGIFAVMGNHDYYGDSEYLKKGLVKGGINLLFNTAVAVENGSDKIWILGVDDPYHDFDNLDQALKDIPEEDIKLLLAHSPEIIPEAVDKEIDMVFMGHTHGGQAKFPGYKLVLTLSSGLKKYMYGLFRENKTQFYVTKGLGRVTLPIRFLSAPEVAIFVLK